MTKRSAIAVAARDSEIPPDRMCRREMTFEVRDDTVDAKRRTVELTFSSTVPYARWWGIEILDHSAGAVRLDRLNGSAALLVNHENGEHVGVVEKAWVSGDKGHAVVRFGKSTRATEVFDDVLDGIRRLVSVGYMPHRLIMVEETDGESTYNVTDWEPYEISIVSVPADPSVGVGRDGAPAGFDPRSLVQTLQIEEENNMSMTRNAAAGTAPAPLAQATSVQQRSGNEPAPVVAIPAQVASSPQIDVRQVQNDERHRAAQIRSMGDRLNCGDLATSAIADGRSLDQFVSDYQAHAGTASALRTAETPAIGMSEGDLTRFSITRLLNAASNPSDMAARAAAAFEFEASDAALARGQAPVKPGCLRIPHDVMAQRRDLTVGTATAGGHLVATNLLAGSFIDQLQNAMAVAQLGATMLTDLNGNVAIPRATGGASVFWVAENSAVTESQPAFDQVALTPKTAGTFVDLSRQLLMQSSIGVENFVRMDLARRMALGIDLAAINGSGSSNQPRGVMNVSGIGAVVGGTNGLAPTWDHIVDLETQVAVANADIGATGYLTNAKVRGRLKRTQEFAGGSSERIWGNGDAPVNGYRAVASNQVPSNLTKGTATAICSAILFGNWADLLIGMWGGLDILPNPYILSGTGAVRLEVYQSVDIAVRHPESFAAMLDALTT